MKILIVEDEMLERKAMVHLIRTGFPQVTEILTAENGEKAVETALSARPELVLMDINLPLLDGIEAAARIRERIPEIRIIMVSAYSAVFSARSERGLGEKKKLLYGKAKTIGKAKKYMEAHFEKNITLQDVAEEVCLEKSYRGRMFREECGVTVMGYLREVRIERAKKLLWQGMSPGEVAEKTGFGDPAYFAKSFKQAVGISPSRYRENKKADG